MLLLMQFPLLSLFPDKQVLFLNPFPLSYLLYTHIGLEGVVVSPVIVHNTPVKWFSNFLNTNDITLIGLKAFEDYNL